MQPRLPISSAGATSSYTPANFEGHCKTSGWMTAGPATVHSSGWMPAGVGAATTTTHSTGWMPVGPGGTTTSSHSTGWMPAGHGSSTVQSGGWSNAVGAGGGASFDPVAAGWKNVGSSDWMPAGPVQTSEWIAAGTSSGPIHTSGWRPTGAGPVYTGPWMPVGTGPATTLGWMPAGTSGPIQTSGFTPCNSAQPMQPMQPMQQMQQMQAMHQMHQMQPMTMSAATSSGTASKGL